MQNKDITMDGKYLNIWIKSMDFCCKYFGCHQLPERSFFIKGYQMPICARCTGIIIGYIVGIITLFFNVTLNIFTCLLLIVPMVLDGSIQYLTSYHSNNIKRLITGLLSGFGLILLIKAIIIIIFKN